MKRVLLVQLSVDPPRGDSGVGAWMLEALKDCCQVSLLTWVPPDLARANRFWGTALQPGDFALHTVPDRLRRFVDGLPLPLGLLRQHAMMRVCKQIAQDYDVLITANNEADLGRPAIQYVHFPWGYLPRPDLDLRWYHRAGPLAAIYGRFCRGFSGFSEARMKQNLTLVNSDWVGSRVHARYGIETTTLFPPVSGSFAHVPWADREDSFVCLGRIAPGKRQHEVIEILHAVRQHGFPIRLRIVGAADHGAYFARIRGLAQKHGDWVSLAEGVSRQELAALVSRSRYGIHGNPEEHFGMGVAEMVCGGCIVFVPDGGGQVEIVGEECLCYRDAADAVEKITAVLRDGDRQSQLRARLAMRRDALSATTFAQRMRSIVDAF